MLQDADKGIFYIPVSEAWLDSMQEWSVPLQIRIERNKAGDAELVIRELSLQPVGREGRTA